MTKQPMTQHKLQLEALFRDPRLRVLPEQRCKIVENIVHSVMHPYFLRKSPEEQGLFRPHYLAHMRMIADYCLREYIETAEPRLTKGFIKGLHRVLYHNTPSVQVKAMDGSMLTIVPGEFKITPVMMLRPGTTNQYYASTPPEEVELAIEQLLSDLHDVNAPLFSRYLRFMIDLTMIHPFPDSNGKMAYLLGDLFLLRQGFLPPYFARFRWENEAVYYQTLESYRHDPQRDISIFYPALLQLYAECGFTPAPEYQVLTTLLAEAASALETGDLPVSAALTVDNKLVASSRNTVVSSRGRRFHAERNLLASLEGREIPAGRRALWVTLEPCMRCAQAIARFDIDELVYVLDDPFCGGRRVLDKAGITVTRKPEWEQETLRLVMDFYDQHPEGCVDRAYWQFRNRWRRHVATEHKEDVRALFLRHLAPYITGRGVASPAEAHTDFFAWVDGLTDLALQGYRAGAPDITFVRSLHRALFPPGHRLHATGNDGVATETGTGEWRRHLLWPRYGSFSDADKVEHDLTRLLSHLSRLCPPTREDALAFILDFWAIHPFTDGNGRLSVLLADLFCLVNGLVPVVVDHKHEQLKAALLEAAFIDRQPASALLALVDGWNQGRVEIRGRSLYDDMPAAFKTYMERSANKQYTVEHILARLAGWPADSPLVITDLGAGTGEIADALLNALSGQGRVLTYHYLEPCHASVEHFRATSHHAALPAVQIHAMSFEEFLIPPSDLILAVQCLQYISNPEELLRDLLASLRPGGIALLVNSHPDSEELRMGKVFGRNRANAHRFIINFLACEAVPFKEEVVESVVRISPQDRHTPQGDSLIAWYLWQPANQLTTDQQDAFWQAVAESAPDGLLRKKESFFWIGGGVNRNRNKINMPHTLPPQAAHFWNARHLFFSRWDEGIQTDWQGLYSVKAEMLAMQLARLLPGKVVLDGFCGIGGCAIAFARAGKQVFAVELDPARLKMARHNARLYGVEDRISFITGDVVGIINTLDFDAAFFDPPWGGAAYHEKPQFNWHDFSPNPLPLIRCALARCSNVALSVPLNFNMAALKMAGTEYLVRDAELGGNTHCRDVLFKNPGLLEGDHLT